MTHGNTYNKSPRRINHKATRSKTNTGTTALERSVEQTIGGFKALSQLANFTLGPDATLNPTHAPAPIAVKHTSARPARRSPNSSTNHHGQQTNHRQNPQWSKEEDSTETMRRDTRRSPRRQIKPLEHWIVHCSLKSLFLAASIIHYLSISVVHLWCSVTSIKQYVKQPWNGSFCNVHIYNI